MILILIQTGGLGGRFEPCTPPPSYKAPNPTNISALIQDTSNLVNKLSET